MDSVRGLIAYVMALMNGARVGIAAQSPGSGEAAFRLARRYAASLQKFRTGDTNIMNSARARRSLPRTFVVPDGRDQSRDSVLAGLHRRLQPV